MENNHKWFILNVVAGQENKVANEIKTMMLRNDLKDHINDVLVPSKPVFKIKRGKKVQENQRLFPGYVFINSDLGGNTYNILTSIPKVMGFLGSKNNPKPVAKDKMDSILNLNNQEEVGNKNLSFEVGETVNVIEGPFESFSGVVEEFDIEKQKLKISVLIFGRATSVELDVNQVEKI